MLEPFLSLLLLLGAGFWEQTYSFFFLLSLIVQSHNPLWVIKYQQQYPGYLRHISVEACNMKSPGGINDDNFVLDSIPYSSLSLLL